jgi:hypothetical protein
MSMWKRVLLVYWNPHWSLFNLAPPSLLLTFPDHHCIIAFYLLLYIMPPLSLVLYHIHPFCNHSLD